MPVLDKFWTGIRAVWGQHLKRKGRWFHYYRAVPKRFADVERRQLISFSLKTCDFAEAKLKAAQVSLDLDRQWEAAVVQGHSLTSNNLNERYRAAADVQIENGFAPKPAAEFGDDELLERMRVLLTNERASIEQKALLGLTAQPELSMADAFERFWGHIEDEWMRLSHDQCRVKRNVYLKSIRNFETAVGKVAVHDLERRHALQFRSWWVARVGAEGLKPYTGNREINSLRRMLSVNFDMDGVEKPNPSRVCD